MFAANSFTGVNVGVTAVFLGPYIFRQAEEKDH